MVAQPDLNFHNPEVQDWAIDTLRFWLDRGVDGFRFDTVNFYFHDRLLRDDAADFRVKTKPAFKTYDMQYHLFSKNQPENLAFLSRIRTLMDGYGATTSVGEVGEDHHPLELMGQYTSDRRLHMAYSFGMMGFDFTAAHFRNQMTRFFAAAPNGWPCWAFSNHDVVRHLTRWMPHAAESDALARLAAAMLLSFRGSICIFQGEELGQIETELTYDELIDPQGKSFWPDDKGRDGCRTPMVWDETPDSGFSKGTPWLPIKAPQAARAASLQAKDPDSVFAFYRQMIALRQERTDLRTGSISFLDTPEPILAFRRGDQTLCVFNLSSKVVGLNLPYPEQVFLSQALEPGGMLTLGPNGFVIAGA
jgi:alpha-glucosidase